MELLKLLLIHPRNENNWYKFSIHTFIYAIIHIHNNSHSYLNILLDFQKSVNLVRNLFLFFVYSYYFISNRTCALLQILALRRFSKLFLNMLYKLS
jgi:hypothetical protein